VTTEEKYTWLKRIKHIYSKRVKEPQASPLAAFLFHVGPSLQDGADLMQGSSSYSAL
jgi:hypothetical protein